MNIRCLEPVVPPAKHHDYDWAKHKEAQDEEEPEEESMMAAEDISTEYGNKATW